MDLELGLVIILRFYKIFASYLLKLIKIDCFGQLPVFSITKKKASSFNWPKLTFTLRRFQLTTIVPFLTLLSSNPYVKNLVRWEDKLKKQLSF